MSQITTHILDTSKGKPAPGVQINLYKEQGADWKAIADGITNQDGRIPDLLPKEVVLELGVYKMKFRTNAYFEKENIETFYPYVEIVFSLSTAEHYHIPLLLNPFGFTTYRGS